MSAWKKMTKVFFVSQSTHTIPAVCDKQKQAADEEEVRRSVHTGYRSNILQVNLLLRWWTVTLGKWLVYSKILITLIGLLFDTKTLFLRWDFIEFIEISLVTVWRKTAALCLMRSRRFKPLSSPCWKIFLSLLHKRSFTASLPTFWL